MKQLLLLPILALNLFAISPYNLEGIKELNVRISDKGKLLPKETKLKFENKIREDLEKLGIKTNTKEFVNFVIKLEGLEIKEKQIVNVSLIINENINPTRDPKIQGIGLTYMKNDLFEVEETVEKDIEDTIFNLLFDDFKKQYKEEN